MDNQRSQQPNSGVSTASVVVAAAIIIVLAVILYPMFARPGEVDHHSYCSHNMHECAIAIQTYCQDYNGCLPSSAIVSGSKKWNRADFVRFATVSGARPVTGHTTTWVQALYPHMRARDIIFCPSDNVDQSDSASHTSYNWKLAVDKAWYGVGCKKPCRKETDFSYNADQVVLYERAGFHDNHPDGLGNDVRINVAYLDTHVRNVTLINCAKGLITDPTSLGEPMYFNFDNTKLKSPNNPPAGNIPANHTDPSRFSDALP